MPPVFPRRRSARFAELVDLPAPLRPTAVGQDLADLVDVADRLRHTATPRPDPEFRAGLRAMLVATAEREGIGATAAPAPAMAVRSHRSHRLPRRTGAAIAVGLATGIAGVASLSAASGPGDSLYSLKRSGEQAQLAIATSDVDRGNLYLGFARIRMREADASAGNPAGIYGILTDMDIETRAGVKLLTTAAVTSHDQAPLNMVTAFLAAQTADMPDMLSDITGAAHGRAVDSRNLLDDVRIRATWLLTDLPCTSIDSAKVDDLGPRPQSCSPSSSQETLPALSSAAPSAAPIPSPLAKVNPSPGVVVPLAPKPSRSVPPPPPVSPVPEPPPVDAPTVQVDPPAAAPGDGTVSVDPADPQPPVDVPVDVPVSVGPVAGS